MSSFKAITSILGAIQTIIAIALAGISIWFFIELKNLTDLRNKDKYLIDFTISWPQATPWLFLFISIFVICVNACGVHSACSKKPATYYTYLGFVAIATLLCFAAGIIGLTCGLSESSDKFVSTTVSNVFDQIKVRKGEDTYFGHIERRLRCCGVKGSIDYIEHVPKSCCVETEESNCNLYGQSRRGCSEVVLAYSQMFIRYSSIGSIVLSLLGAGCVIFAVLISLKARRKQVPYKAEAEKEPLKLPL